MGGTDEAAGPGVVRALGGRGMRMCTTIARVCVCVRAGGLVHDARWAAGACGMAYAEWCGGLSRGGGGDGRGKPGGRVYLRGTALVGDGTQRGPTSSEP